MKKNTKKKALKRTLVSQELYGVKNIRTYKKIKGGLEGRESLPTLDSTGNTTP